MAAAALRSRTAHAHCHICVPRVDGPGQWCQTGGADSAPLPPAMESPPLERLPASPQLAPPSGAFAPLPLECPSPPDARPLAPSATDAGESRANAEPKAEDHCADGIVDNGYGHSDGLKPEPAPLDVAPPPSNDLLSVCRICMAPAISISIFDNEEALRMCEKVMACAAVQIERHDGLPDRICQSCVTDLEVAYNFKMRCEKSDVSLRERLGIKNKTIVKTEFVLIDCDDDLDERATRRSRAKKRSNEDFVEEDDFSVEETDDPSYETIPKKKKMRRKRKSLISKSKPEKHKKYRQESDDDDVILVPPKKRKSYPCPHCDKTFPYPSVLKVHSAIHAKKKQHKCALCSEAFVYTKDLYAHYGQAHPEETTKREPASEAPKSFPCSMCDKVFGENKNLKVHEAMHMREKKYTCEGCDLGFTNMTVLNSHKKQAHPELCRPFVCNICNRSFKQQSALERHVDCHKIYDTAKSSEAKKAPLVKDLFKSIAPLTTTYWSDSFSD